MAKKKIKKKFKGPVSTEFSPIQYDLGGDLSTSGMMNNNVNKKHIYLNSGERALAGIANGLASSIGLGSLVDAGNARLGVTDQLNNSSEYKAASGITGGVVGLGKAGVNIGTSLSKMGNQDEEITSSETDYNTINTAKNNATTLNNSWNMADGGSLKKPIGSAKHALRYKKYTNELYDNLDKLEEAPFYANGGNINIKPSHRGLLHENLGIPQGQKIPVSALQIHEGDSEAVRKRKQFALNAKSWHHGEGGNLYPEGGNLPYGTYFQDKVVPLYPEPNMTKGFNPVPKSYEPYLQQLIDKKKQVEVPLRTTPITTPLYLNKKDMAVGGWIPPQDQLVNNHPDLAADAYFTYGDDWYNKLQQEDQKNPIFDQSTYDPTNLMTRNREKQFRNYMTDYRTTPSLPWKTFDNPLSSDEGMLEGDKTKTKRNKNEVFTQENTYSNKTKFGYGMGGNMGLSEANGGFVHEDPDPQNVNEGVPLNENATVEVGETIFNPEDYVFSDRIKVPGKKYSFAEVSKKIKNKFKLRPDDKLSKEAITQDLTMLMNEQEAIKQAKAQKLMQKALELSPQMALGGKVPSARGALANRKATDEYYSNMKYLSEQPTINQLYDNSNYPVDKKTKKFPNGGEFENIDGYQEPNYGFTNPNDVIGLNQKQYLDPFANYRPSNNQMVNPINNPVNKTINQPTYTVTGNTVDNTNPAFQSPINEEELKTNVLSSTKMPMDYSGINAANYGLQALGEGLRLGLTPNSRLTGNTKFNRINTYPQEVIAKKQAQEAQANLLNAYRNSGVNPSQYLSAATTGIGDINQQTGLGIAGINNQGQMTNAQIQAQEAQLNKQLELQRNDIIAQDIANRSNQLGAVGAGLTQNLSTTLKDKSARDTDLYALQFMNKDNYKMATTKEEADKYGVEIGDYFFVPNGYKTKSKSKIKKKYNK